MKNVFKSFAVASTIALSASLAWAAGTHPITGEALADDQTFTYRVLDEASSYDPQLLEDVDSSKIARDLFEGLYNQDSQGNLIPGVALSHTVSDDKTVYTFKLRDNAKWSDGKPVTANDFVYAWRRLADPATGSAYQWYINVMGVKNNGPVSDGSMNPSELGVVALDDHTLQVTLEQPLPYFPLTTIHTSAFPTPQWAIEAHGNEWTRPGNIVTNGAYIMTEYVANERSVRERNPMYWNNDDTIIEKVTALVINDENVALTRYMAGELDQTDIPSGQFNRLQQSNPDETVVVPELCTYYYTINLTESGNPALQDVRVRQALSYAIDRDIITKNILQAGQKPAYAFTPEATAGFTPPATPMASLTQAERDAKAKELMAAAGVDGFDLELMYNTSESHKKIAIAISQMWKQKLGVNVTLTNLEWKTYLDARGAQNYQIARAGWCGDYNEASTFLDLVGSESGYNDAKYNNPKVDELLAQAKVSDDTQPIYTEIEQILAQDAPIIPIYQYTANFLMKTNVKGWPYDNVEQNIYSRDLYKVAE